VVSATTAHPAQVRPLSTDDGVRVLPATGPAATSARLDGLSDAELVARAQAGDREAFGPLYRRYARDVVRYVASRAPGRGWAFADDVAADTWATVLRKIDKFSGMTHVNSFRAWLYGIAGHQMLQTLDRADGREVATADEALERACDNAAPTRERGAVDEVGRQALRARIYHAVAQLGPKQREVIRLRLEGLSPAEVAERTGWTRRQVRSVWEHAKENLRARLADPALAPGDVVTRLRALDDMADADPDAGRGAGSGPPVERRAHAELRARVDQAVAGLNSPRQREVVRLRLAGLSPAQVAERTGWTQRQVNRCWTEGRRNLERALADTARADTPAAEQPATPPDNGREAGRDPSPVDTRQLNADETANASTPDDASHATSNTTAAPTPDASLLDARRPAVNDTPDASAPDTRPDTWQHSRPDTGRPELAGYRVAGATDDNTEWRHELQLVGAGVGTGDVHSRARVAANDDADGW